MEIREIQAEDTYEIRHTVMWPDKDIEFVKLKEDNEGNHFGLFEDDKLISIISLFYKNEEMQFRKFATLTDFQGRGYGTNLLKHIFQLAEKQGVKKIWCNARGHKSAFYEKFGMRATGAGYTKGGVEFVVMVHKTIPSAFTKSSICFKVCRAVTTIRNPSRPFGTVGKFIGCK